ncbi:MAG TPA: hypothetical protein VIX82_16655 [Solirubrobacteraceae bacterium]
MALEARKKRMNRRGISSAAIAQPLASGQLQLFAGSRFDHRRTSAGMPVHYELFVAAA